MKFTDNRTALQKSLNKMKLNWNFIRFIWRLIWRWLFMVVRESSVYSKIGQSCALKNPLDARLRVRGARE